MAIREIAASIKENKRFLLTTHVNPEGDALGAALSLFRLLSRLGKKAEVVIEDKVLPREYSFLPFYNRIRHLERRSLRIKFDCLVVLDCSDLSRTGQVFRLNRQARPLLNIDHHISNSNFAKVNWVDPKASSTCEMIYRLYQQMKVPVDKKAALLLYTGIMTDTGSFRYSNTTSLTHRIAASLLGKGLDAAGLYQRVYENALFEDMRFLSRVLPAMRRDAKGKVIWFQLDNKLLRRQRRSSIDLSEYILSFGRSINGVEVCVLFKENLGPEDEVRVNLRSQGSVDVNKIASYFGGGGHKTASGATIKGRLDTVRRQVLKKIRESLK